MDIAPVPERLALKTGASVSGIEPQDKGAVSMKHFKIAGLCLVSMLVMGMALAGNASAAPLWLLCLPGTGIVEYENNQCITERKGGDFVSVEVKTTDEVRALSFTITLKDPGTGLGTLEIQCWGVRSEGYVGSGGESIIRAIEVPHLETLCKGLKVCESTKINKIEINDLPWTEVLETGTENMTRAKIEGAGAAGSIGWEITCDVPILGQETDECTTKSGEPEEVAFLNEVSSNVLLVLGRLLEARQLSCTLDSSTSGSISGLFVVLLASGQGLSINLT